MIRDAISFSLNTYFLHRKLLLSIVSGTAANKLKRSLASASSVGGEEAALILDKDFIDQACQLITSAGVRALEELLLTGTLREGELITIERAFYFKGLGGKIGARPQFHTKLPEFDNAYLRGEFNPEHITCSTAYRKLSGRSKVFMLAHVDSISGNDIRLRPIIMADRIFTGPLKADSPLFHQGLLVCAEEIHEFSNMRPSDSETWDVSEMGHHPERHIKEWFAEIIHEGNVPKDWAGEHSDLYTTHLHVRGHRARAAFIFKGPSVFRPLRLKDLGKNGDQIVRLFQEPADLYVLQHCHHVTAAVDHTMRAFASRPQSPSYYCILNGVDTLRILKGYEKI